MTPFVNVRRRRTGPALMNGAFVQVFLALMLYLVVAFDSDLTPMSVSRGIQLPPLLGSRERLEAIRVEVAKEGISVEGVPVVLERDKRGHVAEASLEQLSSLFVRLRQQHPNHETMLIVADARLPFGVFQPLMRAAETAGLTRWTLQVLGGAP